MAFAQSVQISVEIWWELLEVIFFISDVDFEETACDLFSEGFAANEDHVMGNQSYLLHSLALEINFKFGIEKSHSFDWMGKELQFLSV